MVTQAYAQTTQPAPAPPTPAAPTGPGGLGMGFLFQIALIGAAFYFLVLAPGNKERKKREELLKSIQRGDKVLTKGGIWGIVADIKDNTLTMKIAENTKVEVDRAYIENVEKPG